MKMFSSQDSYFSLLAPNNFKAIDSTPTSIRLVPDSDADSESGSVSIQCMYIGDKVKSHLKSLEEKDYQYYYRDIQILMSNDSILFLPSYNIYAFKKRVGDYYYVFNSDNQKFSYNELRQIYLSLEEHKKPEFDMTAIGPIKFGSSTRDFNVQKSRFLREYPKLGNHAVENVYPTFVDGKLAAVKVVGKDIIFASQFPATDWHNLYDTKYGRLPKKLHDAYSSWDSDWTYYYMGGCKTIIVNPNEVKLIFHSDIRKHYYYPYIYIENSIVMDKERRRLEELDRRNKADERQHSLDAI